MADSKEEVDKLNSVEDSLEDSLSSEDWTIIDKKQPKDKLSASEETDTSPEETVATEDACQSEEFIEGRRCVEECVEANEKEVESDDVSILSDESEPENIGPEDERIERIEEWQVERKKSISERALTHKLHSDEKASNIWIVCSVVALITSAILAGQIIKYSGENKTSSSIDIEIQKKSRELDEIHRKLNSMSNLIGALNTMTDDISTMQKLKDHLVDQRKDQKPKISIQDYRILAEITENNWNTNTNNDRLEMLGAAYQDVCLTINRINASSPMAEITCDKPKILSDMITFKKNLKHAFELTKDTISSEKRFFIDVERKLDSVSESLLSELAITLSKFTLKIEDRLSKFGFRLDKLNKQICHSNNNEPTSDQFLNILRNDEYLAKACKKTTRSDPAASDSKSNITWKGGKHEHKKSPEESKKNNNKYDYKNTKEYKKTESMKDDSKNYVKSEEVLDAKSKGEVMNDNWKKNKYENIENNYERNNKREKYDNNYKKNQRNKKEFDHKHHENYIDDDDDYYYDNSVESNEEDSFKYKSENNKRNGDYKKNNAHDRKHAYKTDDNTNFKFEQKKDHDYKFEQKKDHDSRGHFKHEHNNKNNNEQQNQHDEKKSKELLEFLSKMKKRGIDQLDGDWQTQRGEAREKMRNHNRFVRADSGPRLKT